MKLPLVDEIREARRRAEEAHLAMVHLQQVQVALHTVGALEERALLPDVQLDLPGEELVDALTGSWPSLAALGADEPPAGPLPQRLSWRRGQLEVARETLAPLVDGAAAAGEHLHELQHQQRHLLEAPEWSEAVAELTAIGAERESLAQELQPIEVRLGTIGPAADLLARFSDMLGEALAQREAPDPRGHQVWRAAQLARTMEQALARFREHLDDHLDLGALPALVALSGPTGDPAVIRAVWEELEQVQQSLTRMVQAVEDEVATLRGEQQVRRRRHGELTRSVVERMG